MKKEQRASRKRAVERPVRPLIYRERVMTELTGLSRCAREAAMLAGTFPRPVALSARAVGWIASEIDAWVESRKAERDAKAA